MFQLMSDEDHDEDQRPRHRPMRTYRTDAHAPYLVIPERQRSQEADEKTNDDQEDA